MCKRVGLDRNVLGIDSLRIASKQIDCERDDLVIGKGDSFGSRHLSQATLISFSTALNSGSPVTSSAFFSFASAAAKASARLIGKRALKSAAVSAISRVVE